MSILSERFLTIPPRRRYWYVQLMYLIVSCTLVSIVLWLPLNREWLSDSISRFYSQRERLDQKTDVAERRQEGYVQAYPYIDLIRQRCQPNDYFLIPPQRYLIRNAYKLGRSTGYNWLYPSVLYYHLGKSVQLLDMTASDSLLQRATHTFWVFENKIFLLTFKEHNRPLVMGEFKKYDPHFFAYTPEQARTYYKSKP
ncbi:hypothetical protein IC229_30395 [Spirosoma sp. BT702]|uniref:Uncharacterized protein n=1 Tax=Spirosoma profusum TaxID=2771354 RepID=A0A927G9Z5_9BACT|nr:hypothetical protein [Spirosoma profusum]MBD2704978.1 hypothetical protein [Spirosoma profusum]